MNLPLGIDTLLAETGSLLAAVLTGIAAYFISKLRAKAEKSVPFWESSDTRKNNKIKEILQEIRILFDADRILLFQIHNGEYFVTGESARKLSLTHFEVGTEIIPISPTDAQCYQAIPLTFMVSTFTALSKTSSLLISRNNENTKEFQYTKALLSLGNAETAILTEIKNSKGTIGVMFVCYLHERKPQENEINALKKYAEQLSAWLTIPN